MATEDVTINIRAELRELRESMAKLPNITEAAAQKMAIGLEKRFAKAEKAANKAAKASKDAGEATKKAFAGLGAGGALGDLEDLSEGIAGIMKNGLSPMGKAAIAGGLAVGVLTAELAALGASVAAAGALATEMDRVAREADKLAPVLNEIAGIQLISAESIAAAGAYEQQMSALSTTTSGFGIVLVDEYAPAMERGTALMTGLTVEIVKAYDELRKFAEQTGAINMRPDYIASAAAEWLGLTDAVQGLVVEGEAVKIKTEAAERSIKAQDEAAKKAADDGLKKFNDALSETKKREEDLKKLVEEGTAAYFEDQKAALLAYAAQTEGANEAYKGVKVLYGGYQQLAFAMSEATAVSEHMARGVDWDKIKSGVSEYSAGLSEVVGQIDIIGQSLQAVHEQQLAQTRDEIAATKAKYDAAMKHGNTTEATIYKLKLERLRKEAQEEKRAAKRAYAVQKAMAITGIIISSAQAAMAMLANPAIALIPPPGNVAAAIGIASAAGLAQIAAVAAAPPPKFHTGRSPDELPPATLTRQEGVLSPRAVAAIGGPSAVTALNRGTASVGAAPTLYLSIDGKQADAIAMSAVKNGKGTRLALRSSRSEPVGAGHYGSR